MGELPPGPSSQRLQGLNSFDWGWEVAVKAKCAAVSIACHLLMEGARAPGITHNPCYPALSWGNIAALMALA